MATNRYRQVFSLYVWPDFKAATKGNRPPPYVDYTTADHQALADHFAQHFYRGERVRICVADDAIDQVTLHMRMAQARRPDAISTEDFAQALLSKATGTRTVANVRPSWEPLHHLKDRSHAPPPSVVMFVAEGTFTAVMIWAQQAMMQLGIAAANPTRMFEGPEATQQDYEGRLTAGLSGVLTQVYGVPFEPSCMLQRMQASSQPPAWVTSYAGR